MAERKVYVGSTGPFLYDDLDLVNDPDGDFVGQTNEAFRTDGQIHVVRVPTHAKHVIRLEDLPYGSVTATVNDVTGFRSLGTVYQNTAAGIMIVQISVRLSL